MNGQIRPWHQLQPYMEMPIAVSLLGQPNDSFAGKR
jgi:hypothetical protein